MELVVNAAQMRQADQNTIEVLKMPQAVLMERAALAVQEEIQNKWAPAPERDALLIAAGDGNNGADGVALARLFALEGYYVTVWLSGHTEHYTSALQAQLEILQKLQQGLARPCRICTDLPQEESWQIIVDAMFGTGLSRDLTGEWAARVSCLNGLSGRKAAVDLPSGISADNGQVMGTAFQADLTVTFAWVKQGQILYPGRTYCGTLRVRNIGISEQGFPGEVPHAYTIQRGGSAELNQRPSGGHKGTFGKVLLIAGSQEMPGAAILAGRAVLKSGAGMLKLITPLCNRELVVSALPEAMLSSFTGSLDVTETISGTAADFAWADTAVIGPGIGRSDTAVALCEAVLGHFDGPVIADADALNLMADDSGLYQLALERAKKGRVTILTPHIGEFCRLLHVPPASLLKMRPAMVENFCRNTGCILVSKDAATIVGGMLPDGHYFSYYNQSGNSGMATAGSGDVLSGILGAICAGRSDYCKAAATGVYLHGLAGDLAAQQMGEASVTASDLIHAMTQVLKDQETGSNQSGTDKRNGV